MLKIAICDDENIIVNQIEEMIESICNIEGIPVDLDAFYCGKTLENEVMLGTKYDLIFLDIQMKDGNGIAAAKNIRKVDENALIIYVSSYDKYMMELFQLDVFAFIKKPIKKEVFTKIFFEANRKICNKMFYFTFRYKNEEYKILCKDILYFESSGRKVNIHHRDGEISVFNGKLSEVEERLYSGKIPFMRIHQSYLVNYYLIKSRSKSEVTLSNGQKLPISEERQKKFNIQYSKLLGGEVDV
ncbi:DNA-binding response regulator [Enterocloster clostridioformis]|nr:DNA-binding response regulator [Lachnoclostridium sp. YL32]NDO28195.1 response regulator transcription factor [Enterocloster clostridioformis]OXE70644.1 DNA-binding response regulator [Enterocloster clostridioformis]QQR00793.1 response regulator transcription factor [Enterocloster clostridioformis]